MPVLNFPSLDNEIPVSAEDMLSFRNKGHLHVKGLLNADELSVYRSAINDAAYRYNT